MYTQIQSQVKELEDLIKASTGKSLSAYAKLTMLSAEVGELADELIALEGDRVEDKTFNSKEKMAKELVDVLFNTLVIANHYNINIDEYFDKRLEQIKSKF